MIWNKIEPFLKPSRFFDVTSYKGTFRLFLLTILLTAILFLYPNFMEYEGDKKIWWYIFGSFIGFYISGGLIYGLLLIYTKKHHPNIFKKIVTKEYLEFTKQTIDDENKVVAPSVATRPGDQELKVERKNE